MKRLLVMAVAVVLAFAAVAPQPASSHALLSRAEPPINAQVREPPTVLTLYFTEPLERKFSSVRVTNQQNERLDERVEFDDTDNAVMRVYLKDVAPNYLSVSWETVSTVDGHRISGSYPLTVLESDGRLPIGSPPAPVVLTSGAAPDPLRVISKLVLLIAGCALTGALAFVAFVLPGLPGTAGERVRSIFGRLALRIALGSIAALALFGCLELLLQASELGVGAGDVLETQWGERWLWRNLMLVPLVFFALAAAVTGGRNRAGSIAALISAAVYMAVTSSVSHSAAGTGAFWAAGSDFIHLVAASVWVGMLGLVVALFIWTRRNVEDHERYPLVAAAVQRFSGVAVVSVALLLFSGTFNTIVQVDRPSDLLGTDYGNALLAKLLLLLPLLFVGAANAYLLRPDLVDELELGNSKGRQERLAAAELQLHRTMRWEFGLAVAVIAVVALLVQLTPTRGRIDSGEAQGLFVGSMDESGIFVTLEIDPRESGSNTFSVYMAGAVEDVESVRLNFRPNGDSEQESRLILEPSNPPTFYLAQGANLTSAGDWEVQVFIRRAAGTGPDITLPFEMNVPLPGGAVVTAKPGGAFDFPVTLTAGSAALLVVSGLFSAGVVFVSLRRPGLPGGYGTLIAERISDHLPSMRPAYSLIVLVVLGVGLGMWIGSHRHSALTDETAQKGNPIESTEESIARGQMLFATNCSQCHGETGRGDGPLASSLPLQPANLYDHIPYHPDQFFFNVITSGLGGVMPAFGSSLSDEDRWNILNYLRATFREDPLAQ